MLSQTPRVTSIRRWSPMNKTSFPLSISPVTRACRGGTSPAPTDVPMPRTRFLWFIDPDFPNIPIYKLTPRSHPEVRPASHRQYLRTRSKPRQYALLTEARE